MISQSLKDACKACGKNEQVKKDMADLKRNLSKPLDQFVSTTGYSTYMGMIAAYAECFVSHRYKRSTMNSSKSDIDIVRKWIATRFIPKDQT
jgi:hypothetical protein